MIAVAAFALDRTEVTVARYAECVRAGRCTAPVDPLGQMRGPGSGTLPVVNITHSMAEAFCGWTGGRLPTDYEWTFAARGIDGRRYPWGERRPDCGLAWMEGCFPGTHPVGTLPDGRGPFGHHDLAGNVAEWVSDSPTGARATHRGVRGGSFRGAAMDLEVTERETVDSREARIDLGFRCARGL